VKQIDMPLTDRREAGEHAEDITVEPVGVRFEPAPQVNGLWAIPPDPRPGAAVLYLFGGGYVLGSPASRRKTAGHIAMAAGVRVLAPAYRLAPERCSRHLPVAVDPRRRSGPHGRLGRFGRRRPGDRGTPRHP
jgi:acetyl esterase/lipase